MQPKVVVLLIGTNDLSNLGFKANGNATLERKLIDAAPIVAGRRLVVLDGPTCLHQYIRHGSFLWDAAAVLAIVPQVAILALGGGNVAWKLFRFLRMLRLLRVKRLAKAVWGAGLTCGPGGARFMFELTTAGMYGLCVVWILALLTNLLGCFWLWLAEMQGVPNSCCYFALSTITTAVYGDVICTTVPEIAVVMLYDCFSVFWWACVVTLIFEVIEASSRDAHKASVLLDQLFEAEGWMQERQLPGDLQQRVRRFYAEVWAPAEAGNEAEQLQELPAALRADVVWRLAGPALRASRLLRPLPEEALRFLAADLRPCHTPAGLDMFKQGDTAKGRCYILQAALAVSTCSVWCLEASHVAALMQDDPALAHAVADAYLQYLEDLALP
ncbi:cyclic nucleotide-binding [Chlorella sorokiniana]|uniref:Cyclic nucleotide-binding n=1 Tax=Chlorella sorokiniana TaxID=3076 RepID=A0A2P6U037_CHLSO|nr:cyclic nucleotide-binding [Chlorella sorokiniana]|eukprot:PRW59660.1 cyclic nucleotide-binding [Chlorella sorokiniana]